MFSKLYDIFTKKSKSAKDKIAKKIEDATSDEAMDNSAINRPIKVANTFRGLAMGATAILAFATWHISVPFALAAAASSFIINEYGIESNNKKRQTLLKTKKETKDKKKEYDALRVQGKLKPKEEYKKGNDLVRKYQKKHKEQENNIAAMKRGQLVTSIATTAGALATLAIPVAGPFLALGTLALAASNGIIKSKTNKAIEEQEETTLEYNNFINEHKAFIQQCKDEKLKQEKAAEEAKKAKQNSERQQQRQQQRQSTAQSTTQNATQQQSQGGAQNSSQHEMNAFDRLVFAILQNNPQLTLEEAIDEASKQVAELQKSVGKQKTKK